LTKVDKSKAQLLDEVWGCIYPEGLLSRRFHGFDVFLKLISIGWQSARPVAWACFDIPCLMCKHQGVAGRSLFDRIAREEPQQAQGGWGGWGWAASAFSQVRTCVGQCGLLPTEHRPVLSLGANYGAIAAPQATNVVQSVTDAAATAALSLLDEEGEQASGPGGAGQGEAVCGVVWC
jgi:hypothetical protein